MPPSGDRKDAPRVRWRERFRRVDGALYSLFAGALVLFVATRFYGAIRQQIFYSTSRGDPYLSPGDWSAPLDDVFIHFDFARQAARGRPFEWAEGNGYSSGGTSLLYPLVLAPGFWLGFRDTRIMLFAALVACVSVLATLLGARRLFRDLPAPAKYLAPPFFLAVGAVDWSLYSGMEVAFFLATWALALVFWDDLVNGEPGEEPARSPRPGATLLGLANGVVAATRPEAVVVVAVFSLSAAVALGRRAGRRAFLETLVLSAGFGAAVVVAQAVANRVFTGDWSAAGAIVKLEINDPRLTAREVWDAWLFHVRYQIGRVTGYHVGGDLVRGSLLWVLSGLSLVSPRTRKYALLLVGSAVLWVLVVAFNGQVRWQNERYTMPAVAWMLLAAALGVAAVLSEDFSRFPRSRLVRGVSSAAVLAVVFVLGDAQAARMRDQLWFFGRASRNILDQHVKVGRKLGGALPPVHRILVGDAGAIPYAADVPALDLVGLGGYKSLSFARASRWGVGAAVELIERIPPEERPDVLAIYPGWWGDFPLWFGHPVTGVSVRGNVICGGLTKMIYAADFHALDFEQKALRALAAHELLVDQIDFADIVSEAEHRYRMDGAPGFVAMKLLEAPERASGELWDAGRVVPPGVRLLGTLRGFSPGSPARLVVRTAPTRPASVVVAVDGVDLPPVALNPANRWVESVVEVPAARVTREMQISLSARENELVYYHLWGIQAR
ncbi:MAG TPA: hypothetical protein VHE30_10860 [Polyangiaceae bacterium]|nr:hypothetical protein [Polyangiaceae bacterium]